MTGALLQGRSLVKDFPLGQGRTVRAVYGVCLDLAPGQRLAVVGESGSGKSTLLNLLLGLEKPTGGSVTFAGRDVRAGTDLSWLRRRIQYVPQHPSTSFNPTMRIIDAVAEPLACLGVRGDHRSRAMECLDQVSIGPDLAHRRPGELSGGQRQRAAIARALAVNPEVVLADEAVSDLDPTIRLAVLTTLVETCARHGVALVLVTHDLGVAAYACDSVLVLQHGRAVDTGTVRDVFTNPSSAATRHLVDAVAHLTRRRAPPATPSCAVTSSARIEHEENT
ncbi:MAG: ABC transporter ATP-binding protein [Micrococcales bacterium]|nr:MAG: ABC transporter ATP-binding protein [Micrococcales bacterium]PIE27879.1 MAG: ABC transporter ATP-binding protein [Micrococcales bacterium]